MPQMREKRLVMDGSICEDADAFASDAVMTFNQALAFGRTRCPLFSACSAGDLNRRGLVCSARLGHIMAQAVAQGSTIEQEAAELAVTRVNAVNTDTGFINPYSEHPEEPVTDPKSAVEMTKNLARVILFGPEGAAELLADDQPVRLLEEPLPDFRELIAMASTPTGIDTAVIEAVGARSTRTNGGTRCDVRRGPCACSAFH